MRYILHYHYRLTGQPAENVHAGKALLDVFSGWKPPEGLDIREFTVRVDGRGGTIICDTDIPSTIYLVTTQYSGWMDWDVRDACIPRSSRCEAGTNTPAHRTLAPVRPPGAPDK